MKKIMISAFAFIPAVLTAQVSGQAQGSAKAVVAAPPASAQASAQARATTDLHVPDAFSASAKARLHAMYADARKRDLPAEAMEKRVAEGEAKGASEAAIIAAAGKVQANMEMSQEAMLAAGRPHPSGEECERGAMLMARGVTSVQIEQMARHTPSDRSLVVAFDVIGRLADQGLPVTQALARVQAKIDGRASDAALVTLAGAGKAGVGTTAGAGVGVGAATRGTIGAPVKGVTTGLGAGVAGSVTGVIKKP
ncbi:MAG: hypothetical protein ACYC3L_09115 [Gemmatimonadaceae bacterium]